MVEGKPKDFVADKVKASVSDQITELEKELAETKYNKRTQFHIGLVKAKLARLKEKEIARGKKSGPGDGYSVRKSGDGTVVLLGFPSVGKSTLLNALTNANSPVGAYAFTTLTVIPGVMEYKHAKIQILDVPGIVTGAASGRGRGKEVLAVIRNADMILIIIDVFHPEHYNAILKEVYDTGVRINQRKPDVKITKAVRGGIHIGTTVDLTHLDNHTIESVMREFRLSNADIVIREDITVDQLIDIIESNKIYLPAVVVVNKVDLAASDQISLAKGVVAPDLLMSAEQKTCIAELKELIYHRLGFISIYLKEVNKKADMDVPLIMLDGSTIRSVCLKLHRDFLEKFKFARIWGKSVRFDGQKLLKLDHKLADGDILELHMR